MTRRVGRIARHLLGARIAFKRRRDLVEPTPKVVHHTGQLVACLVELGKVEVAERSQLLGIGIKTGTCRTQRLNHAVDTSQCIRHIACSRQDKLARDTHRRAHEALAQRVQHAGRQRLRDVGHRHDDACHDVLPHSHKRAGTAHILAKHGHARRHIPRAPIKLSSNAIKRGVDLGKLRGDPVDVIGLRTLLDGRGRRLYLRRKRHDALVGRIHHARKHTHRNDERQHYDKHDLAGHACLFLFLSHVVPPTLRVPTNPRGPPLQHPGVRTVYPAGHPSIQAHKKAGTHAKPQVPA